MTSDPDLRKVLKIPGQTAVHSWWIHSLDDDITDETEILVNLSIEAN